MTISSLGKPNKDFVSSVIWVQGPLSIMDPVTLTNEPEKRLKVRFPNCHFDTFHWLENKNSRLLGWLQENVYL